jgi:hypothetical protein
MTKQLVDPTLTYGEVDFVSLGETFLSIENNFGGIPQGKFYDIGSGTGKGCLAAALLYPFDICIGFEILEGLHN